MFKITLKVAFQNPIGQKARTVIDLVANVRSRLTIICIFITIISLAQNKKVCFSYDDLPVVSYGRADSSFQKNLMKKLIGSLNRNRIPAIGFVNETKLYNRSGLIHFQVGLLDSWSDSGLDLGNHTYSHLDYNTTPYNKFTKDILDGEIMTKKILNRKGKTLKYFRHPFLHMGNFRERADSLNDFLTVHGYLIAPVTIDNEDYLFALAYHRAGAKKDKDLMIKIGHDYVDYIEMKLKFYERQANDLFGRNISHILLLHASLLNSDYTESLAGMFRKNNYDFITIEEALEDSAYRTEISSYGNWGISWVDRWALSKGKKGEFFKGEPFTPKYIVELAK